MRADDANGRARRGRGILVVRLGSMGDVIHTLPAASSLKHSFPGSTLAWVVHPRWAPLLQGNPFVDRVILLDRRSARSVRQAWRELRACRFDIAVDFQGLVQSALVASLARADKIFGFHQSQIREKPATLFYSRKVRTSSSHVVDRNLELAAATGASKILRSFPLPEGGKGSCPPASSCSAAPWAAGAPSSGRWNPTASWPAGSGTRSGSRWL
jgi:heptosyltransferase-1